MDHPDADGVLHGLPVAVGVAGGVDAGDGPGQGAAQLGWRQRCQSLSALVGERTYRSCGYTSPIWDRTSSSVRMIATVSSSGSSSLSSAPEARHRPTSAAW